LEGFNDGQQVVVLVRPETIQVQPEQPINSNWNIIPCVVETITFHGASTRLGVNVSGQRVVADITVANIKPVSLNQKIWLLFPPDACQVMAVNE
jgi:ABC-type Fe3+/spermidine/putrescine transport system ATPase subunit